MNKKTSQHKGIFSCFSIKAISLFTVIVFICSDFLSFPSRALAQTPDSSDLHGGASLLASAFATSGKAQEFVIPPELGKIEEINFAADGGWRMAISEKPSPSTIHQQPSDFVVLIQDAHSVPDAQQSLEKLIEYLQEKYGVTTVALEGAEGKLDTTLFRLFPDAKKREAIFGEYLGSGELSGAAAASVLSSHKADYVGIEDWKLYQQGVTVFLSGLKQQPELRTQLSALSLRLQALKQRHYSAKALEFDAKYRAWQADPAKLAEFIKCLFGLATRLPAGASTAGPEKKYPALDAVMASLEQEQKRDPRLEAEVKKLARFAHRIAPSRTLNGLVQDYRTGRVSLSEIAYQVATLTRHRVSPGVGMVKLSPELQQMIANHEKLVNLKGPAFSKELDSFDEEVRAKLLVSPEAMAVNEMDIDSRLLAKLTKFELSRAEWNELRKRNAQRSTRNASQSDIESVRSGQSALFDSPLVADFFRFYEIALQRENVFLSKIGGLMNLNKSGTLRVARCAVVTGGFHTDGLAAKLKEQGTPYAVISPRIQEVPGDNRYFDQMQGKVSWSSDFKPRDGKIDLYAAFSRATVKRLSGSTRNAQRATSSSADLRHTTYDLPSPVLKEWRDEVIRALARDGRVADHAQYTRYIDETLAGHSEEFQELKGKWTAKLEKFIEGLRLLQGKNQLTEANVAKLFSQPAMQTPYAATWGVPGAMLNVAEADSGLGTRDSKQHLIRPKSPATSPAIAGNSPAIGAIPQSARAELRIPAKNTVAILLTVIILCLSSAAIAAGLSLAQPASLDTRAATTSASTDPPFLQAPTINIYTYWNRVDRSILKDPSKSSLLDKQWLSFVSNRAFRALFEHYYLPARRSLEQGGGLPDLYGTIIMSLAY